MLTDTEKRWLREAKCKFIKNGGIIYHNRKYGVCIVMKRTGQNMGEFSVSIKSPSESEYDKHTGEYYALIRFLNNGEKLPFVWFDGMGSDYIGYALSSYLGNYQ